MGKILEVRAGDSSHVYLRVYWLYLPEDLPDGRQTHHGETELIASNHMDIVGALSVIDKADVVQWDEDLHKLDWPLKDRWFWRQTYDLHKPKAQQLSVRWRRGAFTRTRALTTSRNCDNTASTRPRVTQTNRSSTARHAQDGSTHTVSKRKRFRTRARSRAYKPSKGGWRKTKRRPLGAFRAEHCSLPG